MKLYLIVAKGKHQGMPILVKVDLFLMGSENMCQLRSSMAGMAPQHCAVITRGRRVFVRDLGGGKTYVNNELVPALTEWPLHARDRLTVGPLEFLVQFQEKQLPQRDAEAWAIRSLDLNSAREGREVEDPEEEEEELGSHSPETASAAAAAILGKLQLRKGIVKGRLRVLVQENTTIIRFEDPYVVEPAEIAHIKKDLLEALNRRAPRVLLDFKNVRRMSSSAVEMIQDFCRRVQEQMCAVACCRVRDEIRSVMTTLGIFRSVRYFGDKKSALTSTW